MQKLLSALVFASFSLVGAAQSLSENFELNLVSDFGLHRATPAVAAKIAPLSTLFGQRTFDKFSPAIYGIAGFELRANASPLPTGGIAIGFTFPLSQELRFTLGPHFRFQHGFKPQFGWMVGIRID